MVDSSEEKVHIVFALQYSAGMILHSHQTRHDTNKDFDPFWPKKHTTAGIRIWSPTILLISRYVA
ncbi:hypothetical protein IQ06DRAFT_27052 [Phaeosphaeriaceae sp. SRC1lsM3a]|nr:hypothetical protein IQ06DRAFT_27052 [Stagonospora sp. SRC1lsM3a]